MNVSKTVEVFIFLVFVKGGRPSVFENVMKTVDDLLCTRIPKFGESWRKLEYVKYYVSTTKNRQNSNEIDSILDRQKIADTSEKIFFLIHGWEQNRTSCPWFEPLTDVLLKKYPKSSVVQVDWSNLALNTYTLSVVFSQCIGAQIANTIQELTEKNNEIPLQNIVIIGHSLGAQIAGWIGKNFYRRTKKKLSRIIALDPAGPIFRIRPSSRRLNQKDAEVVLVVHTDIITFGYPNSCGTIDFFPKGGSTQTGCEMMGRSAKDIWCSHRKAADIFIEALKHPQNFLGTKCGNFEDYEENKCDRNEKDSIGDWLTTHTGKYYL